MVNPHRVWNAGMWIWAALVWLNRVLSVLKMVVKHSLKLSRPAGPDCVTNTPPGLRRALAMA